jgi:hypothetical protein
MTKSVLILSLSFPPHPTTHHLLPPLIPHINSQPIRQLPRCINRLIVHFLPGHSSNSYAVFFNRLKPYLLPIKVIVAVAQLPIQWIRGCFLLIRGTNGTGANLSSILPTKNIHPLTYNELRIHLSVFR